MTTNVSPDITQQGRNPSIWIGVLLIVLGLAGIFVPRISTLVTETWIAIVILSAGFAKFGYAFQTRQEGGFAWKLLLSILYIGTGIMLFVSPLTGILTLTILLGTFLVSEGTFELILAFRLRPQQNWTWVLGNGIITLLLGAMVWFQFPFDAPWLLGTLVGASILFTGISRVGLALNPRATEGQPTVTST